MRDLDFFFFVVSGSHRDLHALTHSCPTRRSSDLACTSSLRPPAARLARGGCRAASGQGGRVRPSGGELVDDGASRRRRAGAGDHGGTDVLRRTVPGHPSLAVPRPCTNRGLKRSEEHTSELQSLMRISYAVFCLKKKKIHNT